MNLKPNRNFCGLCFLENCNLIDIYNDNGINRNIPLVLTKHFWFLIIDNNEESIRQICHNCWTKTMDFHIFYQTIELVQRDFVRTKFDFNCFVENVSALSTIKSETFACVEIDVVEKQEVEYEFMTEFKIEVGQEFENNGSSDAEHTFTECDGLTEATSIDKETVKTSPVKKKKLRKVDETMRPKLAKKESKTATVDNEMDTKIKSFFKMECEVCGIGFETYLEAKLHYRKTHNQKGYISCCGRKFFRRFKILDHIMQHVNPIGPYSCDHCLKKISSRDSLKQHMQMHVPQQTRPYKCEVCPKTRAFMSQSKLKAHMRLRHCSENDKIHVCKECDKRFAIKSILDAHVRGVHQNLHVQICDICAIVLKNKYTLKQHKIDVHGENAKPRVQCDICGSWLKNANNLRKHKMFNCDASSRPLVHKCPYCDKLCTTRGALLSHQNYVHVERKYQCTLCEKAFKKPTGLKEHMALHTGQDLYTCQYCPKTFKSNANMHSHRKKSHPDEWLRDRKNRQAAIVPKNE